MDERGRRNEYFRLFTMGEMWKYT